MARKKQTKIIDGIIWYKFEGDDFWSSDGEKA